MAKTSELLNRRGCGGILTPLPTCQPVAFNCSLSVTRVLGKVTVSPVFLQAGSPAPGALSPGLSRVFLTHESPGQQHTCSSPVQGPPGTVRPRSRVHSACYPLPQVLRGRLWGRRKWRNCSDAGCVQRTRAGLPACSGSQCQAPQLRRAHGPCACSGQAFPEQGSCVWSFAMKREPPSH